MPLLTVSFPRKNLPPIVLEIADNGLPELARRLAEKSAINSGTPLQGMAIGGFSANSPDDCPANVIGPSLPGASQAGDGAQAEPLEADDPHDTHEFESLAEARAYWAAQLAEADEALAPWKARENENKEKILATHGRFDRSLLDASGRSTRAVLFAERDRLLPAIGPLRKRRQECQGEVKTLTRRMEAEQALKAREARKVKAKRRA